ncbi:Hypothetical predicted protein [Pelobates cultripes]|uniref:Uncharacterized protein n=1 Tax=Pelobates cultripes TaxID=61616 RepID=A0AAD1TJH6_PELCU|nr:Hypothetical predicted protein [Pelobates cultripes]
MAAGEPEVTGRRYILRRTMNFMIIHEKPEVTRRHLRPRHTESWIGETGS